MTAMTRSVKNGLRGPATILIYSSRNCCRLSSLLAKGPRASRSIPLAELDQGARSGTNLIRSSEPASWMA
jgi:hypothetical protein